MYRRAVYEKKYIGANPLENEAFKRPLSRQESQEVEPYTPEEIRQLLAVTMDTPSLYTPLVVLVTTGMRCEEVLALRWKNLDMENQVIHICGAMTTEVAFDMKGEKVKRCTVQKGTKSKVSTRDVGMLEQARTALTAWKAICEQENQRPIDNDAFVFRNRKNDHWTYSGFRSAIQRKINKHLKGFGNFCAHRIRHYVGTALAASNAAKFNIMTQLGHSKESTTLRYIGRSDKALVKANGTLLASGIQGAFQDIS